MLNVILTLSRVSNLPTVWTNCLAAWAINQSSDKIVGHTPAWHEPWLYDWGTLGWILVGGSFFYAGGCVLNDGFDQNFDRKHNPNRPIPSGQVSTLSVWIIGFGFLLLGGLFLVGMASCSWIWVLCLLLAIIIYDWIHKNWTGSVWIMGSCRTFLWLTAASAGGMQIMNPVLVGSLCVGSYIVGISLFARNESKKSASNNSGSVAIFLLFTPCLLTLGFLIIWNHLDPTRVFLLNCLGIYLGWIIFDAITTIRNSPDNSAIGRGVSILLVGICAVDALVICFFVPSLIAPCYLAQFFAQILQKKFAAT